MTAIITGSLLVESLRAAHQSRHTSPPLRPCSNCGRRVEFLVAVGSGSPHASDTAEVDLDPERCLDCIQETCHV